MTAARSVQIALLYARHAATVYRLVARRVGAPPPSSRTLARRLG
jgi:hypothetical protein